MSHYNNTEIIIQKGGKIVRKVNIKKDKGTKSITKYRKGKKIFTIKKPIHKEHIKLIKKGRFIPGLFNDCKDCKKKRGGIGDIEMGPDIPDVKPYPVSPEPKRFENYEEKMRTDTSEPGEVERVKMGGEEPLNRDHWSDLQLFTGGRKSKTKKRKYI